MVIAPSKRKLRIAPDGGVPRWLFAQTRSARRRPRGGPGNGLSRGGAADKAESL